MTHRCQESQYLERLAEQLRESPSWHGDSLLNHIEDVKEIFDSLFEFYGFQDMTLCELGHYLAYYHDISKPFVSGPGHGHSLQSVKLLQQNQVHFKSCEKLTFLAWYLISRHHSNLVDPNKQDWKGNLKRLDWDKYFNFLRKENIIDFVDVADIFGLFKLADIISTHTAKGGEAPLLCRPHINGGDVKRILGGNIDKDRWNQQLRLLELPRIAMLRAPTGWGKTTSSLLFSSVKEPIRVFYLLPTITAIKEFFNKLNSAFAGNVSMYFYLYDAEVKEEEERLQQILFIKSFISPIVVTTVDQFLLTFLQLGKYFTKRISFRRASIILDEVHLLTPLALHLFTYFLNKFKEKYRLSCLIMSATLPEAYVQYLRKSLGLEKESMLDLRSEYSKKRRTLFYVSEQDITSAVEKIYNDYTCGNRVLVVVNTVDKSIEVTKQLRKLLYENKFQPNDILLIHSRFMYSDRRRIEETIEGMQKNAHVLVSTQVCEVSLDVSYDKLYTEAAPLGSIIQRFGRVNRYGTSTDKINAFIYFPRELHVQERSGNYPYEYWEVKACWEVLKELEGNNLRNELELLERFDKVLSLEELMSSVSNKFDIKVWEEGLFDFLSLRLDEEKVRGLFEYRESFTMLALIHPDCIHDEVKRQEVLCALNQAIPNTDYNKRLASAASLKDLTVPIPVHYLRNSKIDGIKFGLPLVKPRGRGYSVEYGFH